MDEKTGPVAYREAKALGSEMQRMQESMEIDRK